VTHFAQVPDSLITASRDAELLVLGLPNHGATTGPVLGSVALDVSAHALCPCVVVRGDSTQQPGPDCPIVVGVDGSPGSDAAVRYAARVAAETEAPLHLIAAYRTQPSRSWSGALRANARGRGEVNLRARARQAAKELTRAARRLGLELYPGLKVTEQVLEGSTVPVLITAAHRAALLVVGSRGLGGFAGRMLGSVSNGAIHDAPCPVAILRGG
jgi:nucleotide-binding universal stress UspA family protein